MAPEFVPALELNAGFYRGRGRAARARRGRTARRLLGWGSEILGFDTARSTDHGWGPRLQVFVDPADVAAARAAVDAGLPASTAAGPSRSGGMQSRARITSTSSRSRDWLQAQLGCNPLAGTTYADWLTMPQQKLLGVTRGAVFHDATGELAAVRARLRDFPRRAAAVVARVPVATARPGGAVRRAHGRGRRRGRIALRSPRAWSAI